MANDHYVTRSYLERFIHPTSKADGNEVLFPYSKGRGACRCKGTKRLGCAEDFYRIRTRDGGTDKSLDDVLSKLESFFFRSGNKSEGAYARVANTGKWPSNATDKLELASIAAMLRCRAPVQIHNAAMQVHANRLIDSYIALKPGGRLRQLMLDDGCTAEEIDKGRLALFEGDLTVDVGKEYQKQEGLISLPAFEAISAAFEKMRWRLVVIRNGETFITGDNPVVLHVQDDPVGQALFQNPHVEVWFPIAHDKGFLIDHRDGPDAIETLGHSQIRVLNRRVLKWANRFVYSPLPEEWLELAARTESFNPLRGKLTSIKSLYDSIDAPVVPLNAYLYSQFASPANIYQTERLH